MGWWTRRIVDGRKTREARALRDEIAAYREDRRSARAQMAIAALQEKLGERDEASRALRRARDLAVEAGAPRWRILQIEERLASLEGRPPGPETLELEQDGVVRRLRTAVCLFGRSARTTDLVVASGTVAREHCVLWHEDGAWRVRDLESTNGTRLDGVPVEGEAIFEGSGELRLAERVVRVTVLGPPDGG